MTTPILRDWQVMPEEIDKDYIRIRGTIPGTRHKIANVPFTRGLDGKVPEWEANEARAVAALVAAAPELREAVRALLNVVEYGSNSGPVFEARAIAYSAIAKATKS